MTFAKAIKILDLLDHDKTIVVKEYCPNEDGCDFNGMYSVDRFSKYDEISDYMKYFTDSDNKYHFYLVDNDGYVEDDEIEDD